LGKAQELVALLADYHEMIWVHPKIAAFCDSYMRAGVKLPPVEIPAAGAPPGALVVMPPNFARSEWRALISRPRVCFCSGWAMSRSGGGWYVSDQAIPLSDHADCESLVKFALATGARTVYTLHGFASDLAELLRAEGMNAYTAPDQWQGESLNSGVQYTAETLDLFRAR
jgi:putative mRNA 3-end processing factor